VRALVDESSHDVAAQLVAEVVRQQQSHARNPGAGSLPLGDRRGSHGRVAGSATNQEPRRSLSFTMLALGVGANVIVRPAPISAIPSSCLERENLLMAPSGARGWMYARQ
jgi:hypothetical protein